MRNWSQFWPENWNYPQAIFHCFTFYNWWLKAAWRDGNKQLKGLCMTAGTPSCCVAFATIAKIMSWRLLDLKEADADDLCWRAKPSSVTYQDILVGKQQQHQQLCQKPGCKKKIPKHAEPSRKTFWGIAIGCQWLHNEPLKNTWDYQMYQILPKRAKPSFQTC